jgi:hypothetical protein
MPQQVYPWGKNSSTYWAGRINDPTYGMDTVPNRNIPSRIQLLATQPIAQLLYYVILIPLALIISCILLKSSAQTTPLQN